MKATRSVTTASYFQFRGSDSVGYATAWTVLGFIAVAGSLLYGASLSLVFPGWQGIGSAVWLALSAGLGWCVFLPALWIVTKRPLTSCVNVSLVTMAFGEVVLIAGSVGNLLLAFRPIVNPVTFNISCVVLSNIVMAFAITRQMAKLGEPARKTLALWIVALNGSGAVFFYLLRFLVEVH